MSNETIQIQEWRPNYKRRCIVCDQSPVVEGIAPEGDVAYKGDMCGMCTWGEAEMAEPANWNKP